MKKPRKFIKKHMREQPFICVIALLAVLFLLVACAPAAAGPAATQLPPTEPAETQPPAQQTEPVIPQPFSGGTGDLIAALEKAGATVNRGNPVDVSLFNVGGIFLKVNGEDIQVFEFADEESRQAAAETIQANGYIIGNAAVDWITQPYFYSAGRLIAIYVGTNPEMQKMLTDTLGEPVTGSW